MGTDRVDDADITRDAATIEEAATLLREVLESVDSAEVPVGGLPREMATRRRLEGAAAALEALSSTTKAGQRSRASRRKRA